MQVLGMIRPLALGRKMPREMATVATHCPGGRGPVRSIARTVVADSLVPSLGLNLDAHNLTTAGSPLAKFRPEGFNDGKRACLPP
jgi:hypothetical protein